MSATLDQHYAAAMAQLAILKSSGGEATEPSLEDKARARTTLDATLEAINKEIVATRPYAPDPATMSAIDALVNELRGARRFQQNFALTGELIDAGVETQTILLQHAQSAMELKQFPAAEDVLNDIVAGAVFPELSETDQKEFQEKASAQLGRMYKQIYIDGASDAVGGRRRRALNRSLRTSIALYGAQYEDAETVGAAHYPGVNYLALVWRAQMDGVDVADTVRQVSPELPTAAAIACELLTDLLPACAGVLADRGRWPQSAPPPQAEPLKKARVSIADWDEPWALASCGEAILALESAGHACPVFDHFPDIFRSSAFWYGEFGVIFEDPFKIGSAIRQLEEVWLIDGGDAEAVGAAALSDLRLRALAFGGDVALQPHDIERLEELRAQEQSDAATAMLADGAPQRIIAGLEQQSIERLFRILDAAYSVGRVNPVSGGTTLGTGFLFPGDVLGTDYAGETLFITNAHLVSTQSIDRRMTQARAPRHVRVEFGRLDQTGAESNRRLGPPLTCKLTELVWSSVLTDLDATILRIEPKDKGAALPPALPLIDMDHDAYLDEGCDVETAFILGYPRGGDLHMTDTSSRVRRHDDGKLAFGWRQQERPDWLFVHYDSSTKPGNSGSPVFTNAVEGVYALHHFGPNEHHYASELDQASDRQMITMLNGRMRSDDQPNRWVANQGVLLASIIAQAKADLAAGRRAPASLDAAEDAPAKPRKRGLFGRKR